MSEKSPQPRLQFGIRTLLLLVVVASLPAVWIAYDVNKSRQRKAVERSWNERGAHVNFAPDRRIVWLGYRADAASEIEDDDLVYLKDAPEVEYLDLRDTAITDGGLDSLKNLKKLQGINLSDTAITDVGLQILAQMEQLRVLDVSRTNVRPMALANLKDTARTVNSSIRRDHADPPDQLSCGGTSTAEIPRHVTELHHKAVSAL